MHFKVFTDHHTLKYFFTQRDMSRRQARWSQQLANFQPNMEIVYTPGPTNHADALSRLPDTITSLYSAYAILEDPLLNAIRQGYAQDPLFSSRIPSYVTSSPSGLYYFNDRVCVPNVPSLRQRLLHMFHDSPSAGHCGYLKTLNAIARQF